MEYIKIKGARVNNLKNIDLELPTKKLISITGPSGSGKTSLAFHTLYAESKRRFFNSFPNSMKLFAERPTPVDVDMIYPVLPVFALPQINPVVGSRSNISDILRITEYFQTLFYQFSVQYCPDHQIPLRKIEIDEIIGNKVKEEGKKVHLFVSKHHFLSSFKNLPFPSRCLVDAEIVDFDEKYDLWEIARFKTPISKSAIKSLNEFGKISEVTLFVSDDKLVEKISLNSSSACPKCNHPSVEQSVSHFNPYNALGACNECGGYGANLEYDWEKLVDENLSIDEGAIKLLNYKRFDYLYPYFLDEVKKKGYSRKAPVKDLDQSFVDFLYKGSGKYHGFKKLFNYLESKKYKPNVRIYIRGLQKEVECSACYGTRLSEVVLGNRINKVSLREILNFSIEECMHFLSSIKTDEENLIKIINELKNILKVSINIGLGHLKILRKTKSVSAGEYQRLLLVKYLSYKGTGALFVFDEPSLGLSIKEQNFILEQFRSLIKDGNTVLLVEHSKHLIKNSDLMISIGPKAGHLGGYLTYFGRPKVENLSVALKKGINKGKNKISMNNIEVFNKKYSGVEFKTEQIVLVKGDSGSGKTSVIVHALANEIAKRATGEYVTPIKYLFKKCTIPNSIKEVVFIDANLNKFSSRSSVGTLTDLSSMLRKHFADLKVSKALGLDKGHFSPNSVLGQCSECEGRGHKVIEMQYLEDIVVECDVCKGKKLKSKIADISNGYFTISKAYETPVSEVFDKIKITPKYQKILEYMQILNLDYLSLERKIQSLSGGEKQRIYLLSKLISKIENTLIIVENITFGLSDLEVVKICEFFDVLVKNGNTIVIIDQNSLLDKVADVIVSI